MSGRNKRPSLIVVSPILSKQYGTERIVIEWISRLAEDFEIRVYSQRIRDIDPGKITWRRIPKFPGPHLVNYLWWVFANHLWRGWDRQFRQIRSDLVFSPGINCLDADVISVHIVFAEYVKNVSGALKLSKNSVSRWPRLLHRKFYYRLIAFLEERVYRDRRTVLIPMSRRTERELMRHYKRENAGSIYVGIDHGSFSPQRVQCIRRDARQNLGYSNDRFVLLLIGNHLVNKGLPVLLQALGMVNQLPIDLLVVGRESPLEYQEQVERDKVSRRVQFRQPRTDVEFYYAAADAYVGPSLEDSFSLPPQEAMACGMAVIVSSAAGVSEIITHESDGLILQDPLDASGLAGMIRRLYEDRDFRERLGENAHKTALQYTWDHNARELKAILGDALRRKVKS